MLLLRAAGGELRQTGAPPLAPTIADRLLMAASCLSPSTGRRLQAGRLRLSNCQWPSKVAACYCSPAAGNLLLAPYDRPPHTSRLLLAPCCWPLATGRVVLCLLLTACHWPPNTDRMLLAAYDWPLTAYKPPTHGRLLMPRAPDRLLLAARAAGCLKT